MSRVCPLSGKKPQVGHNVAHSNRKTKRRFLPNLHVHHIWVEAQQRFVKLRISSYGLRLIDKLGFEKAMLKLEKTSQVR
jgi:large subunit ribosomal protein L28